jgi:hypothetical protein
MPLPTYNNWTPVNSQAAQYMTTLTNSPGIVYGFGTNALPAGLQQMAGVASYYLSGYLNPQVVPHGFTAVGEALVARTDGALTKNYNYLLGVNSAGVLHLAGPYKGYGHHVSSGQSFPVNSLFNQTPLGSVK